jgi:hypothetical protein
MLGCIPYRCKYAQIEHVLYTDSPYHCGAIAQHQDDGEPELGRVACSTNFSSQLPEHSPSYDHS